MLDAHPVFSLLAFRSRINLAAEVGGCRSGLREEAGEDWLDERAEDDLGTVGHWEGHPKDEDELEDVVECWHRVSVWVNDGFSALTEPVDGVDKAFEDIQESVDDPVCQPLRVIDFACAE